MRCVLHYVCAIRYLNPVYLIREKHRKLYYFDKNETIVIQPKLEERIFNLIATDAVRRKRILRWVQRTLPNHTVEDFSHSWNDGIVLCALLEAVHPGICPSFSHLKPHNRVNNCRLGLKLAQQCHHLPLDIITPEEMAIADASAETVILKYVSMLKWASENSRSRRFKDVNNEHHVKVTSFTVKGSGIVSGVVGRKARFSLSVADVMGMFHLGIDIKGPKNEVYSEQIISLHQSKEIMIGAYQTQPQKGRFASIDNRVMEYMEDAVGNTYVRWKNLKLLGDSCSISVIPFNCQCTGKDTFLMTYLPISTGIHTISIKWQNMHIEGSPFKIKVYQPRDITRRGIRDAKDKRIIFDSLSLSSIEERPQNLLKIDNDKDLNCRYKNISEKSCNKSQKTSRIKKQFTVTKRRVIRKVISRHGEEIVIQESPSPTLSRQSSMTDTSTEEEQLKKPCSPSPPCTRKSLSRSASVCTEVHQTSDNNENDTIYTNRQTNDCKTGQNEEVFFSKNIKETPIGEKTQTGKRSFSDSMLNSAIPSNQVPTDSNEKISRSNDFNSTIHFPSLKVLQSNSLRKSCCYFSSDFRRQYSFSSTSSASSNSNSSARKIKKSFSISKSLPILNDIHPYNKKMSRLERIRRDKRHVIDIHLGSEKPSTSIASPSTSSLSSLATPSTYSIPLDDIKRFKDKVYDDAATQSLGRHIHPIGESDRCHVKGKRNWEQNMSKHRATTMYWLNNQTTDHFSIDSTDSDPNFLIEQSDLKPESKQNSNDVWKTPMHYNEKLPENKESHSKKIGLQRQFSEIKDTQFDLESCINETSSQITNKCNSLKTREKVATRETKSSSQLNPLMFKSIVTVSNLVPSKVHVVTPKVKANKTTQISVNEILQETTFFNILMNLNVRKRKRYLNIRKENISESDKISIRKRSLSEGAILGNHSYTLEKDSILHDSRQSTIDSGIAEEYHSKLEQNALSQTAHRTKFNNLQKSGKTNLKPLVHKNTRKRRENSTNYSRKRGILPNSSSSFSDSEITTRKKQIHLKRKVQNLSLYQSRCPNIYSVDSLIFSKGKNIDLSKCENLSGDRENQPCLLNSRKDASISEESNVGIGLSSANRNSLLHHVQTFMSVSQPLIHDLKPDTTNDSQKTNLKSTKGHVFYSAKTFNVKNKPQCCYISACCQFFPPKRMRFKNSLFINLREKETTHSKYSNPDDFISEKKDDKVGNTATESNLFRTTDVDTLRESNLLCMADVDTLRESNLLCTTDVDTLRESNLRCTADVDTLRESNLRCTADVDTLRESNLRCTADVDTLRESNLRCTADVDTLRESNLRCMADVGTLRESNLRYMADVDTLRESNLRCMADVDTLRESNLRCMADVDTLRESNLRCMADVDTLRESNLRCMADVDTLRESNLRCTADVDTLTESILLCTADVDTLTESNLLCMAEGAGLSTGQIGVKNNFQVWCHSQSNSAVSVTIHGPRPFSVLETSVIYTGDNLYEVTYDVAYPGYYVICIKCGDDTVPDSPFLARVTF
nr:uncharacterized protein LOC111110820 isoform X2 [Crassostrea virginica]